MSFISGGLLGFFSLLLVLRNLIIMWPGVFLFFFFFILLGSHWDLLICGFIFFRTLGKILFLFPRIIFSAPLSLSSLSGTTITQILDCVLLYHGSLTLFIFFQSFSFCSSFWIVHMTLSSIFSSEASNILLIWFLIHRLYFWGLEGPFASFL